MVKVRIEYIGYHPPRSEECTVSRVPCEGELIFSDKNETALEVRTVFHRLNPGNGIAAIVRVR